MLQADTPDALPEEQEGWLPPLPPDEDVESLPPLPPDEPQPALPHPWPPLPGLEPVDMAVFHHPAAEDPSAQQRELVGQENPAPTPAPAREASPVAGEILRHLPDFHTPKDRPTESLQKELRPVACLPVTWQSVLNMQAARYTQSWEDLRSNCCKTSQQHLHYLEQCP